MGQSGWQTAGQTEPSHRGSGGTWVQTKLEEKKKGVHNSWHITSSTSIVNKAFTIPIYTGVQQLAASPSSASNSLCSCPPAHVLQETIGSLDIAWKSPVSQLMLQRTRVIIFEQLFSLYSLSPLLFPFPLHKCCTYDQQGTILMYQVLQPALA